MGEGRLNLGRRRSTGRAHQERKLEWKVLALLPDVHVDEPVFRDKDVSHDLSGMISLVVIVVVVVDARETGRRMEHSRAGLTPEVAGQTNQRVRLTKLGDVMPGSNPSEGCFA